MMDVEKDQEEYSRKMGQWERFEQLPEEIISEIMLVYSENNFSLVRDFLAQWIESQSWSTIHDEETAKSYLNKMIVKIYECAKEQKLAIKYALQEGATDIQTRHGREPLSFIRFMEKMLISELSCLKECEKKVENDPGEQLSILIDRLEQLEDFSKEIQNKINNEKSRKSEPDMFKAGNINSKTRKVEYPIEEMSGILQDELKYMNEQLQIVLNYILDQNLNVWNRTQRLHKNSVVKDDIDNIQKWCSKIASLIIASQQQIKEICEIFQMDFYQLNDSFANLFYYLLTRTFIVSQQPSQILQISCNFKASVRLLCDVTFGCEPPTVTAELISPDGKNKGKFKNNTCIMRSDQNEHTATFEKMILKKVDRSKEKGLNVTEETFHVKFSMKINVGKELTLEVHSLPVVVLTNVSQKSNACATIIWDNYFTDYIPPGENKVLKKVPWKQFADMLNYIFEKEIQVPLKDEHLEYFALKIFDEEKVDLQSKYITWDQFFKQKITKNKNFTFWNWFYAIVELIKTYFLELYQGNLIFGFVKKDQSKKMLLKKPRGTFLLRFSDNSLGGISVAEKVSGENQVLHHGPFTSKHLDIKSLADIMLKYIKEKHCIYPEMPAREAFKKYAGKKQDLKEDVENFNYKICEIQVTLQSDSDDEQENSDCQPAQNNVSQVLMDCDNFCAEPNFIVKISECLPENIFDQEME